MDHRVRLLNDRSPRPNARYVVYWAQMNRRVDSNHGLVFAAGLADQLDLPLLYYEGLTCSYPHANDRLHTFILEGVPDTARRLKDLSIGYAFYLRRRTSDPDDALYRLASEAAAVVTDDYPTFIARRHNERVPARIGAPYYVVDSSCIVPAGLFGKREYAAHTFRPKVHKLLPEYLLPAAAIKVCRPFRGPIPEWHTEIRTCEIPALVASCEIDHSVKPSPAYRGGSEAARKRLERFLERNLRRYAADKNEPSAHATSGLSPYLHFGHVSPLEIALAVRSRAGENRTSAEVFLEELIVRRELAFNFARHSDHLASLDNLPPWALQTLREHAKDPRPALYPPERFERAETHDELWNATQKELLLRGKIHGYYRMYWGKKIIEWSRNPEEALETMVYLHDRYALDGRDPNTYTNILWCFGLHDRPWFERPVFGTIRYMSLEGMKRKTDVHAYLREIDHIERTGRDPFEALS